MANGDLSRVWLSTAFEAAIDTAATEDFSFLGQIELSAKHPDTVRDEVNGTMYETTIDRLDLFSEGSITAPATSEVLVRMLKYWSCSKPTTAGANPYTHTWTNAASGSPLTGGLSETTPATFTATVSAAGISTYIDRYTGLLVPSLTISQQATGRVQVSVPIEGSGTVATTTAPATTLSTEGYFAATKTTVTIGGTTRSKVLSSLSLVMTSGFNYVPRCGSTTGSRTAIDRDGTRPHFELTVEVDEGAVNDAGGHDDWTTPTAREIVVTFYGDANRSLAITLKNCKLIEGYPIRVPAGHGVYKVTRKYIALNDTATTPKLFSAVVTNATSSYL